MGVVNVYFLLLILFSSISVNAWAKVKLSSMFSDSMVLQQCTVVKLNGISKPNTEIKITTSWDNKSVSAKSDLDGQWLAEVKTVSAGGPYKITFDDGDKLILKDVYLGEVWLCSGQSNMEMPVKGKKGQPVLESNEVIANAIPDIPIRMFTVGQNPTIEKVDTVSGKWLVNSPKNVANFSAVAYFFGLRLYKTLRVPIGLINTSWGGSNIESWMPYDTLKYDSDISFKHLKSNVIPKNPQHKASLLYNGMIYPLRNTSVKGVIWYQGESNVSRYQKYINQQKAFVSHLRTLFGNENLPFYYVQIAPHGNKNNQNLPYMREAQMKCEALIPNSGMAVILDSGEENCIHPASKRVVGNRLAYLALLNDYGQEGIDAYAPLYSKKEINGNKITLYFNRADMGLTSFGKELKNFEIAGEDKIFYKAKARIEGAKVIVWSEEVQSPLEVRYAFHNFVEGDLFGISGLPVSSFRTDQDN